MTRVSTRMRTYDFHLPNPLDTGEQVVQVGADEVKKILNKVLPEALPRVAE